MTATRATSDRSFSDIANHWAKDCILALAQRNIVNGYPDGTFRPDATLTRAEFAALMFAAFPNAPAQREPVRFSDVPFDHWANQAIQWGYTRGFFSGFPDGTFQPNQPISRLQAVLVLVSTQSVDNPANPDEQLRLFFADAGQIPDWARRAMADAIATNVIVNYPDVRQLRPNQNATRGETSALLCRTLRIPNTVPAQYATWNWGIYDIKGDVKAPFATWKGSARLMRDIQVILVSFRLYPANQINGIYNSETERAMTTFSNFYGLPNMQTGVIDEPFAWSLLNGDPVEFIMANAKDRQQVYNEFLRQEAGFNADKLAFLDRGIENSPYRNDVAAYPDRLMQKPNGTQLVSLGSQVTLVGSNAVVTFSPYPAVGVRPAINSGLEFLHGDILQACICVGSIVEGKMRTNWRGRDSVKGIQHWSTTKIIPLLNVVSRANGVQPAAKVRDCLVRPAGSASGYGFYNLAVDLVSYGNSIATSNSIAAMFKQFATPAELEGWLKQMTGNAGIEFRGRYGEAPFIQSPNLYHQPSRGVVLNSRSTSHTGNNFISAYDLTRMVSMLGWHYHLSQEAKLPAAQWDSLETVVRAMGVDTARYIDVAIDRLGLNTVIEAPVIISKLGFGRSSSRNRTEISYVALLQFTDTRPRHQGKPAIQYTIALTLLGAKGLGDANEEARQLDARIAAEVTEILRRVVSRELA
jgi:peptidoglycan hydrolase-like protein with peptidoglycan-binding domain